MSEALVIVESPAKARTINRYLGDGYEVLASMGHVRDLPKKKLGVDVENDFKPTYVSISGKKDVLSKLRSAAAKADAVYLAVDMDREGEAIAWHLAKLLKLPQKKTRRVVFNEITRSAIQEAFKHPRQIDQNKVDAQQARRVLDRLVGYQVSPVLWKKIARGLSAGRVQSVAVRLIVEREREVQAFNPEEFWKIIASLARREQDSPEPFDAQLKWKNGDEIALTTEADAAVVLGALKDASYVVEAIERKKRRDKAAPPFITSTLQQQASTHLRFSAKKTMIVAQQLYEGVEIGAESVGLITYMRTDSVNTAAQAQNDARDFIRAEFGDDYVPEKPNVYSSRAGAQEAHECIRPTDPRRNPEMVAKSLGKDQLRLYTLIWNRFMASQMTPAQYNLTNVKIVAGDYRFHAGGRQVVFPGHSMLSLRKTEERILPELSQGETLDCLKLDPSQHFTEPPPRYTEATLVRELEKQGIGRPSTYATIISTVQTRGYVKQVKRAFHATPLGMLTTDRLVSSFPTILGVDFTRNMEARLDKIEDGDVDWVGLLKEFYEPFSKSVEAAMETMKDAIEQSEYSCSDCGKPMLYRWSKYGRFLGCSDYPNCKTTMPVDEEGTPVEKPSIDEKCPLCEGQLVLRTGRRGEFVACGSYPECKFTRSVGDDAAAEGEDGEGNARPIEDCPECGAPLVERRGRRGPFFGCSKYPECKFTKNLDGTTKAAPEPTDETCEKCNAPMVIRTGRRGRFLACSAFPKCRNTKSIKDDDSSKDDNDSSKKDNAQEDAPM